MGQTKEQRYIRNQKTISLQQQAILADATVVVVGCGGLGGFIVEGLARLGVGTLKIIEFDQFDYSNLNRQVFSTEDNIGKSKLMETVKALSQINSSVQVIPIETMATQENIGAYIAGADLVVDGLDAIDIKIYLEKSCNQAKIPLIHGAIGGNYGQAAISLPQAPIVQHLYGAGHKHGVEKILGNPFYTPCIVGGLMVKLSLDVLFAMDLELHGFYYVDLDSYIINFISLKGEI